MSCPTYQRLCNRLVISDAVTFADDTLTINIPSRAYNNGEKYCIVVAQSLPAETTVTAPVVVTIGEGATEYPLLNCNCTPVTACSINTRTRYSAIVRTGISGGSFVLNGRIPCSRCGETLTSLPVEEAPAATTSSSTNNE